MDGRNACRKKGAKNCDSPYCGRAVGADYCNNIDSIILNFFYEYNRRLTRWFTSESVIKSCLRFFDFAWNKI